MNRFLIITFFALLCFTYNAQSQVGIGTTNPNASLEIQSSDVTAPANTDGILIPKIDEYPAVNPTVNQDGMLVYATGNGSILKGFYYWDNTTVNWTTFTGATVDKVDELTDGKSDNDGSNDGSSLFLGVEAGLNDDSSDNRNVANGFQAMRANSTGTANTAVGYQSLLNNTIGLVNTSFGYKALNKNISGSGNVASGSYSLYNNTEGNSNIAIGKEALYTNDLGNYNVSIGNLSGHYLKGYRNVFIGNEAGEGAASYSMDKSIFIGNQAGRYETTSERLYIENSQSATPLIYGEFDNDLLRVNGDFEVENTANASVSVKTPFGNQSSLKLFESGGSGDYGFEFEYDGSSDKFYLWSRTFAGNEGIRMTWLKDGKVGIGTTAPSALLDVSSVDPSAPKNTDGILIPRIDAFPTSNPGASQNGMLVFLTTDNTFYFWRNSTTSWISINTSGSQSINDLTDGKSDVDGTDDGSSIFLGINAGANDTGNDHQNVGIGFNSMRFNTTGFVNSALGYRTLEDNTGNANSAFGAYALFSNTTGDGNSAFGINVLWVNTTGDSNSAFGRWALSDNTTGNSNSAFGRATLFQNTTGNYNSAFGSGALGANTTASNNSAFGYYALGSNTAPNNSAFGNNTLYLNTTGPNNSAFGNNALYANTTGSDNSAFGDLSLYNNTTGDYNVAMGNGALETNTTANYNVAIGYEALNISTSALRNTAIGYNALINVTTGDENTALGSNSGPLVPGLSNTTAIGYNVVPLGSNMVRIGNAAVSIIGGATTWSVISDKRLKTNIKEDIAGLDFIKKLRPVSYNLDMDVIARFEKTPESLRLRDAEMLKAQEVQTGFIAQEVETAANEVGFNFHGIVKPYDTNGTYALRYAEFVVPLVKGMQEQQDIIESQQEDINALKREIEEIKALLSKE